MKKQLIRLAEEALESGEVCDKWKDKIREVIQPEFTKQKMEKGKWYLTATHGCLVTPVSESKVYGHFRPNHELSEWSWNNRSQYPMKVMEGKELADKLAEYHELVKCYTPAANIKG